MEAVNISKAWSVCVSIDHMHNGHALIAALAPTYVLLTFLTMNLMRCNWNASYMQRRRIGKVSHDICSVWKICCEGEEN